MLPNGNCIPDLFDFTHKEIRGMKTEEMRETLIPSWYQPGTSSSRHLLTNDRFQSALHANPAQAHEKRATTDLP